jgi:hypothetical protein
MASVLESGRASSSAESADAAAVRATVIDVPSSSASGSPVSGENTTMSAWCVGSVVLPGNRVTSLTATCPGSGR